MYELDCSKSSVMMKLGRAIADPLHLPASSSPFELPQFQSSGIATKLPPVFADLRGSLPLGRYLKPWVFLMCGSHQ